jgi:flagellar motility protein MotE (MotC chaperone)
MTPPENKEELRELVDDFQEELKNADTDPSRLRKTIAKVKEYSDNIAKKLIMLATELGFSILVGMSLL